MVDSCKEFFEVVLPGKFDVEKSGGISILTQLDLGGPDGGKWYISVKDKNLNIKEGESPDPPDITVQCKARDFVKLVSGKVS